MSQQHMSAEGYINLDLRLQSFYKVFTYRKKNPLSQLTRQETVRWLIMTAATAHQRRFSQASKKTTPQNMWSRIMAMVMKAEKGEKLLNAGVCSRSLEFLNHRYLRTGSSTESLHVSPQSPAPQSQPGCSPQRMRRSWIRNQGQTLWPNKSFILQNDLRNDQQNNSRTRYC